MAAHLPEKLKSLAPFAQRAAQLEKFDPVISYWCEYYIIKQTLDKGLHTEGEDVMTFTTNLMDKLERVKNAHSDNDAILDDLAASAYVENFALKTFNRADNAQRANQASAQTADTFRAASNFLELLGIWHTPLSTDVASKIKFAKFHALRIVKAIKNKEDPNLTNPPPDPEPSEKDTPMLDPQDPEVQRINGNALLQPKVEDAPDADQRSPTVSATMQSPSIQSPNKPSVATAFGNSTNPQPDVSPLEPSPARDRQGSVGGGYFPDVPTGPSVPTFTSENTAPSLPTAPPEQPMDATPNGTSAPDPMDFYSTQATAPPSLPPVPQQPQPSQPPNLLPTSPPTVPSFVPPNPVVPQPQYQAPQPTVLESEFMPGRYRTDDESIAMAQKHAKWAVSALNFDDVDTAVKELKIALRSLGAS